MQNGYVESFHGRLRDECLNTSWLRTLNDVRRILDSWREECNCQWPHSSLDHRTPREFKLASTTITSYRIQKAPVINGLEKGAGQKPDEACHHTRNMDIGKSTLHYEKSYPADADRKQDAAHHTANVKRFETRKGLLIDGEWTLPVRGKGCKCVSRSVVSGLESVIR